jgi:hypothetical protein
MRTVPSVELDATRRLLGENATDVTYSVWPMKGFLSVHQFLYFRCTLSSLPGLTQRIDSQERTQFRHKNSKNAQGEQ